MQALASRQLSAVPAAQAPATQNSSPLQRVVSGHAVPFGRKTLAQPEIGLHVSVVQRLLSSQLRGVPGWQEPLWQVSIPLHTVPSAAQVVPFGRAGLVHPVIALQPSAVQPLLSLQLGGVPGWQIPL